MEMQGRFVYTYPCCAHCIFLTLVLTVCVCSCTQAIWGKGNDRSRTKYRHYKHMQLHFHSNNGNFASRFFCLLVHVHCKLFFNVSMFSTVSFSSTYLITFKTGNQFKYLGKSGQHGFKLKMPSIFSLYQAL